jgi:hypothetical protein
VHKHVKEGAGEQEKEGEDPEEVRPVLAEEKEGGDQKKCDQCQIHPSVLIVL